MATKRRRKRAALTREKILLAAIELADKDGLQGLSMRKLGQALGVEAMSLYNHVSNKEDVVDGMVDLAVAEIEVPTDGDWKENMRGRAHSAREVFARHNWLIGVMESRTNPGPATLRYHDAVIGVLRRGGFSVAMAAHAFAALEAFMFGFALQEMTLPMDTAEDITDMAGALLDPLPPESLPHLRELVAEHILQPGYAFSEEFEFGLELVLDALDRARTE